MKSMHSSALCTLCDYPSIESFLKDELGLTRSAIKKFDLSKKFLARPTRKGDALDLPLNLINRGMVHPNYEGGPISIIFEDDNFLVLDKPVKTHTHPLSYCESDNCLSFLRSIGRGDLLAINQESYDRGMLFRLDFETSGVLIYSKSDELYQLVRKQFNSISKDKIYLAVVSGRIEEKGSLVDYLSVSDKNRSKMKVVDIGRDCDRAELSYERVLYNDESDQSLVRVFLKTGMRHQIRVQLSHMGHPIVGDYLYGGTPSSRLFLHAKRYTLQIESHYLSVETPTPKSFEDLF